MCSNVEVMSEDEKVHPIGRRARLVSWPVRRGGSHDCKSMHSPILKLL